jgi:hypothetical protein
MHTVSLKGLNATILYDAQTDRSYVGSERIPYYVPRDTAPTGKLSDRITNARPIQPGFAYRSDQ